MSDELQAKHPLPVNEARKAIEGQTYNVSSTHALPNGQVIDTDYSTIDEALEDQRRTGRITLQIISYPEGVQQYILVHDESGEAL